MWRKIDVKSLLLCGRRSKKKKTNNSNARVLNGVEVIFCGYFYQFRCIARHNIRVTLKLPPVQQRVVVAFVDDDRVTDFDCSCLEAFSHPRVLV
jgi:hypothetical protein